MIKRKFQACLYPEKSEQQPISRSMVLTAGLPGVWCSPGIFLLEARQGEKKRSTHHLLLFLTDLICAYVSQINKRHFGVPDHWLPWQACDSSVWFNPFLESENKHPFLCFPDDLSLHQTFTQFSHAFACQSPSSHCTALLLSSLES